MWKACILEAQEVPLLVRQEVRRDNSGRLVQFPVFENTYKLLIGDKGGVTVEVSATQLVQSLCFVKQAATNRFLSKCCKRL